MISEAILRKVRDFTFFKVLMAFIFPHSNQSKHWSVKHYGKRKTLDSIHYKSIVEKGICGETINFRLIKKLFTLFIKITKMLPTKIEFHSDL